MQLTETRKWLTELMIGGTLAACLSVVPSAALLGVAWWWGPSVVSCVLLLMIVQRLGAHRPIYPITADDVYRDLSPRARRYASGGLGQFVEQGPRINPYVRVNESTAEAVRMHLEKEAELEEKWQVALRLTVAWFVITGTRRGKFSKRTLVGEMIDPLGIPLSEPRWERVQDNLIKHGWAMPGKNRSLKLLASSRRVARGYFVHVSQGGEYIPITPEKTPLHLSALYAGGGED